MNLAAIDLNLLVVLDALLRDESVGAAAQRVGISRPAMSNALGRVRRHFGDPILIRAGRRMTLTPRARELIGPVRAAIADVSQVLDPAGAFRPSSSQRSFTILSDDYAEVILLPRVLQRIQDEAPGVTLSVHAMSGSSPSLSLDSGAVDLAIATDWRPEARFREQRLFDDGLVCVVARDHPAIRARVTLEQFVTTPHVALGRPGITYDLVDRALERHHGLRRHVAIWTSHFLSAPFLVARTPFLLVLPERGARACAGWLPLRLLPPPLPIGRFWTRLTWHPRNERDPGLAWLRELLESVAREVEPAERSRRQRNRLSK